MKVVCAWCQREGRPLRVPVDKGGAFLRDSAPLEDKSTSHGMCDRHRDILLEHVKRGDLTWMPEYVKVVRMSVARRRHHIEQTKLRLAHRGRSRRTPNIVNDIIAATLRITVVLKALHTTAAQGLNPTELTRWTDELERAITALTELTESIMRLGENHG